MIGAGLLIMLVSLCHFSFLSQPFQKAYLYYETQSIDKINFYSYNETYDHFLFSTSEPTTIENWVNQIRLSTPTSDWGYKRTCANAGYKLLLYRGDKTFPIYLSPYQIGATNFFAGDHHISYSNESILAYFHTYYPKAPSSLDITTAKNGTIKIQTDTILNHLWRMILWGTPATTDLTDKDFIVPSYLFFDDHLGCKLAFTLDFKFLKLDNQRIIQVPIALQTMLNEQYLLSQLQDVDALSFFDPVHETTATNGTLHFSISLDTNKMYYGLYLEDYKNNNTTLLHTVSSPTAQFFLLNYPYVLLLDEKAPGSYYLMLVNQNIPNKHRYIVKNEPVVPRSIALCPQNTQFAYIIERGDTATLYLVSDYYRSPKTIAVGEITDSLFLSHNYLVFTQVVDEQSVLCVYSLTHSQVIKYIAIPGDVTFISATDQSITFAVQTIEDISFKEGIFLLDSNLQISPVESTSSYSSKR